MPKFTARRSLLVLVVCFALVGIYFFIQPLKDPFLASLDFDKHDSDVRSKIHFQEFRSSTFDKYTDVNSKFATKYLKEKCQIFFNDFLQSDPSYSFSDLQGIKYEKGIVHIQEYFDKRLSENSGADKAGIYKDFQKEIEGTMATERKMMDDITRLRIYNQCFFHDDPDVDLANQLYPKFFPYLNNETPQFEHYVHEKDPVILTDSIPDLSTGKYAGNNIKKSPEENLFSFYHRSLNGQGIVISATSRYTKDIARMIRVLRALNNKLPIQIVYRGKLSEKNKKLLVQVATDDKEDLIKNSHAMDDIWPHVKLEEDADNFGFAYPKQEIWFVDLRRTLRSDDIFKEFNNKLVALAFSSFKETILMDADVVPLKPPSSFFDSKHYKATSTFFFRDRSLRDPNKYIETNLVMNLSPTRNDTVDALFGVKPLDLSKIKDNTFLRGYLHFQEAGMVVIDKKRHFHTIPMLLSLGFWHEPIKSSVYGDKEFYWLSFLLAGDQSFSFNTFEVGSVGEATKDPNIKAYKVDVVEVCSSHPGHVDEKGELLWINSGFGYCKKNGASQDKNKFPMSHLSMNDVHGLYSHPLNIKDVVVPPSLPDYRDVTLSNIDIEKAFDPLWESLRDDLDDDTYKVENPSIPHGPYKSWVKSTLCSYYFHCAYNRVDPLAYGGNIGEGHHFSYNDEDSAYFSYLGKLWFTTNTNPRDQPLSVPEVEQQQNPKKSYIDMY